MQNEPKASNEPQAKWFVCHCKIKFKMIRGNTDLNRYLKISNHLLPKCIIRTNLHQNIVSNSKATYRTQNRALWNHLTCSYKKKTAVENFSEAQLTMAPVAVGSRYISTHSAIIKVGKLMTTESYIKHLKVWFTSNYIRNKKCIMPVSYLMVLLYHAA